MSSGSSSLNSPDTSRNSSSVAKAQAVPEVDVVSKVVFLGDGATGKTSLLMRFTEGGILPEYIPTVINNLEINFSVDLPKERATPFGKVGVRKNVPNKLKKVRVLLQVIDTAGQEEYRRLRVLNYDKTNVFVFVCTIDDPNSLTRIKGQWNREVRQYTGERSKYTPKIIVANKEDLREMPVVKKELADKGLAMITEKELKDAADEIEAMDFMFVSAMTNMNIRKMISSITTLSLMEKQSQAPCKLL